MASPGGPRGGGGSSLGLLLWLLLLQIRLGEARAGEGSPPTEASAITPASPEAPSPPGHLESLKISGLTVAPGPSTPTVGETLGLDQTAGSGRLSAPGCGHRKMRIVGGRPAEEGKWPWQVSLQTLGRHRCGGSLIARQWVLTAAHCIKSHLEYIVKLGSNMLHDDSRKTLQVPVQDIVCHPFYSSETLRHDIALILLAFPVNYSSYIQPVCLSEKAFEENTGAECWVTGWGRLVQNVSSQRPNNLQEAEQTLLHYKKCNQILKKKIGRRDDPVKEGMICGHQQEGKSPCWGDSGGPLVCKFNDTWVEMGFVSWGISCGRKEDPVVYTEVSFYKEWISEQMSHSSSQDSTGFFSLSLCLVLPLGILAIL
uniref:tryptase n=1 Tax=Equus asinus TaxID=9793 RepID=A0A9L0JGT3_EQUAS|nr:serine protease 44-like isoform X1 [Equus asinus]